jgi:hypothetical protein
MRRACDAWGLILRRRIEEEVRGGGDLGGRWWESVLPDWFRHGGENRKGRREGGSVVARFLRVLGDGERLLCIVRHAGLGPTKGIVHRRGRGGSPIVEMFDIGRNFFFITTWLIGVDVRGGGSRGGAPVVTACTALVDEALAEEERCESKAEEQDECDDDTDNGRCCALVAPADGGGASRRFSGLAYRL